MLVAVFGNETAAYEGLSALQDLHQDGDITLYASAVISKNANGELQLKTAAKRGVAGAATGLLAGSLIGLIGGPVGLFVGAVSGILAGLFFDIGSEQVNIDFVDEVSTALKKGKTAIIAEIDEEWTVPVDTRLSDAMIFRRLKHEVADDQLARESKAIAAEYEKVKEELKEAGENNRAEIKIVVKKLETKAAVVTDQIKRKLIDSKSELDAKITAIEDQIKHINESRKATMEKRIAELQTDYATRAGKLKHAARLVTQAFGPKGELKKSEKEHYLVG